jgi:hypothetical protein
LILSVQCPDMRCDMVARILDIESLAAGLHKESRSERMEQRVKPTIEQAIELAATLAGTDTSEFVTTAAFQAAMDSHPGHAANAAVGRAGRHVLRRARPAHCADPGAPRPHGKTRHPCRGRLSTRSFRKTSRLFEGSARQNAGGDRHPGLCAGSRGFGVHLRRAADRRLLCAWRGHPGGVARAPLRGSRSSDPPDAARLLRHAQHDYRSRTRAGPSWCEASPRQSNRGGLHQHARRRLGAQGSRDRRPSAGQRLEAEQAPRRGVRRLGRRARSAQPAGR